MKKLIRVETMPQEQNGAPESTLPVYSVTGIHYWFKVVSEFPILVRALQHGRVDLIGLLIRDALKSTYGAYGESESISTHAVTQSDGTRRIVAGRP